MAIQHEERQTGGHAHSHGFHALCIRGARAIPVGGPLDPGLEPRHAGAAAHDDRELDHERLGPWRR